MPLSNPTSTMVNDLFACLGPEEHLGWLAKHPHGTAGATGWIANQGAYYQLVERYNGWHFFVCPNPTTAHKKPTISDITRVNWAVLDIDPDSAGAPHWESEGVVLDVVRTMGYPRYVVHSGRGLHFYYRVTATQPTAMVAQALRAWVRQPCELPAGWHIDPTSADISHVFRAPSSVNLKTYRECYVARVWGHQDETVINDATVAALWEPPPAPAIPPPQALAPELFYLLPHMPPSVRTFLAGGVRSSVTSRHNAAYAAAAALAELGVPMDKASALVATGAEMCVPQLQDWERPFVNGYRAVAQRDGQEQTSQFVDSATP